MILAATDIGLWALPLAVFAGALRVGTPFLYVSLGECITEKAGRVNLGLQGTLVFGAMAAFGTSYLADLQWGYTDELGHHVSPALAPWLGVGVAALCGALFGVLHAVICNRPRVNSVAVGIAMMSFGIGLAFYFGKALIQPKAPQLPGIPFGAWSDIEQVRTALNINVLFLIGVALAPMIAWMLANTRWGMILRLAGESEEAAAALGYSVKKIRIVATAVGGVLAGIAGSFLSLYYPGTWAEGLASSGQGLMAVALVIFARWNPINCLWAALIFGGVGSLGLALQGLNLIGASFAYLWFAAPYVLTCAIMILTSSRSRAMIGAPLELVRVR
jgi:general nucleoside transport system permease protein